MFVKFNKKVEITFRMYQIFLKGSEIPFNLYYDFIGQIKEKNRKIQYFKIYSIQVLQLN